MVCAAAVEAMDWGRRYLWALTRQSEEAEELLDPTQTLITAFFPAVTPPVTQPPAATAEDQRADRVQRASHRAVDGLILVLPQRLRAANICASR